VGGGGAPQHAGGGLRRHRRPLLDVTLIHESGRIETIRTTDDHPFYVVTPGTPRAGPRPASSAAPTSSRPCLARPRSKVYNLAATELQSTTSASRALQTTTSATMACWCITVTLSFITSSRSNTGQSFMHLDLPPRNLMTLERGSRETGTSESTAKAPAMLGRGIIGGNSGLGDTKLLEQSWVNPMRNTTSKC
jgi:hypothetical protein